VNGNAAVSVLFVGVSCDTLFGPLVDVLFDELNLLGDLLSLILPPVIEVV